MKKFLTLLVLGLVYSITPVFADASKETKEACMQEATDMELSGDEKKQYIEECIRSMEEGEGAEE